MARVSESSTIHAINHSVSKTRQRLENLQLQGSNLKRVQKPSDDPVGNIEILSIRSRMIDGEQYTRNASVAKAQLSFTENAIEELTELLVKVKELAIGQSSNIFDPGIRNSVAKEIHQLHDQSISIANRRLGNKFIFSGFKTLTKPFSDNGQYLGDGNQTKVEVGKDVFVPITFNGKDIFFQKNNSAISSKNPLQETPFSQLDKQFNLQTEKKPHFQEFQPEEIQAKNDEEFQVQFNRNPASQSIPKAYVQEEARTTIFSDLKRLENALLTNNHEIIQDLLPNIDAGIDRLIEVRTVIGSTINKIDNATQKIEKEDLISEAYKSRIEDADVAALFTDLTRQQNVLNATYKSSAQMMNNSLMKYIN